MKKTENLRSSCKSQLRFDKRKLLFIAVLAHFCYVSFAKTIKTEVKNYTYYSSVLEDYLQQQDTIKITGNDSISSAHQLEDVVVVGYGTMSKKEVTSSITSMKNKDMMPGAEGSPIMALQGKVTGLVMIGNSDPNAEVTMQLRGANSINSGMGPLIVVDGIPGGNLNNIPREDIISVDVLKDASAAAIYGTRASGGVILVTTKSANYSGPVKVDYSGEFSTQTIRNKPEVLSAGDYLSKRGGENLGHNTDWFKEVTRSTFNQRHYVSMVGGSQDFKSMASINYRKAQGVDIASDREQLTGRVAFDYKTLKGLLDLSGTANYTNVKSNYTNYDVFIQAIKLNPTETPYDPNDPTGYNIGTGGYETFNPVADLNLKERSGEDKELQTTFTAKLNITSKFNTSFMVGYKNNINTRTNWTSAEDKWSRDNGVDGSAKLEYKNYTDLTANWLINYKNSINNHSYGLMGGYSFQEFNGDGFWAENKNFPVNGIKWYDLGSGSYLNEGSAGMDSWKSTRVRLIAFFGRANYAYDNKYMATISARYEGSSKFHPGNQWGLFPAISAGWRISEEEFLKDTKWLSTLMIRGGFGRTGNEGFGSGKTVRMFSNPGGDWWIKDGQWFKVYGLSNNVNENLIWETKDEYNIGLEYAFLDNRLSGKFDVYTRKSNNLIYDISVSSPPAVHDKTTMNAGTLSNKGWETELTGVVVANTKWGYTTTIRASGNTCTLETLNGSSTYWDRKGFPNPGNPGNAVRLYPGEKLGQFFVYKHAGISDENFVNSKGETIGAGKFLIYNKAGKIIDANEKVEEDKQFIGNGIPKVMLSWENLFTYKNFDLSLYFRSWLGYDVFNMTDMYYGLKSLDKGLNVLESAYGKNDAINDDKELSSYWIEKGDFLKLDVVTLGYNFKIGKQDYVRNLRIYTTGRNLFCWTGYSGVDPEININGLEPGFADINGYPQTRTFLLGLQLGF